MRPLTTPLVARELRLAALAFVAGINLVPALVVTVPAWYALVLPAERSGAQADDRARSYLLHGRKPAPVRA